MNFLQIIGLNLWLIGSGFMLILFQVHVEKHRIKNQSIIRLCFPTIGLAGICLTGDAFNLYVLIKLLHLLGMD